MNVWKGKIVSIEIQIKIENQILENARAYLDYKIQIEKEK